MSRGASLVERGKAVGSVLAGSWRPQAPVLTLSPAEVQSLAPLLVQLGAGSLAWFRLRSQEGMDAAALPLSEAYRLDTFLSALYERQLIRVVSVLKSAGVEPLSAKGWLLARLYPERGVRGLRQIDLWVRSEERERAAGTIGKLSGLRFPVHFHQPSRRMEATWAELLGRSRSIRLGEAEINGMGPEDHLRLLCLHSLYNGVWNPLWLCDIAALAESLPEKFDWDYCTRGKPRCGAWIGRSLGLAAQLLGAGLERVPQRLQTERLPPWLAGPVLRHWGGQAFHGRSPSVLACFRDPGRAPEFLGQLWPNPLQATIRLGAPMNSFPRFPFQTADCLYRLVRFLIGFPEPVCRNP